MGLQEQQNVLARMYTDPEYRAAFLSDPHSVGNKDGLSSDEVSDIAAISQSELGFFSDSLVWKRRREVEKLLPLVRKALGDNFDRAFEAFSASYNHQSVKKHLEDAIEFCKFLEFDAHKGLLTRDTAKFERSRLEFFGFHKPIAVCFLKHDFRGLHTGLTDKGRLALPRRRTIALWLRFGRHVRHFVR